VPDHATGANPGPPWSPGRSGCSAASWAAERASAIIRLSAMAISWSRSLVACW